MNVLKQAKLAELTTLISSGSTPKGGSEVYQDSGPVMLIRSQNVRMNQLVLNDVAYISEKINCGMRRSWVQRGDVLLNITGASIGRVAVFELAGIRANVNQHVCIIRAKPDNVCSRYLAHFLATPGFQAEIDRLQRGGTRQALTFSQIADFDIPLPRLTEQRRIAAILDAAEALRTKRRAALAQLDSLIRAIFAEMFGPPDSILYNWDVKPLGELLTFMTSGSRGWAEHYSASGALFLRIQNVCYDQLIVDDVAFVSAPESAEARRTRVQAGDVLLSVTADLGRTGVIPPSFPVAYINQHLMILRTSAVVPRYLSAYLASPAGQRQIQRRNREGVKAGLNFDDVRSFPIPLPPRLAQQSFVDRVVAVEKLREVAGRSIAALHAVFASLQHRAFRGEL